MDRPNWTTPTIGAIALLCALLLVAGVAFAAPPLLPGTAFVEPRPCALDPFADADTDQREQQLARTCGADRLQLKVNTPRLRPIDTGPSRVEMEVDQLVSMRRDAFTASARLGWSGAGEQSQPLQTHRAIIAAGGLWRLDEQWALDLNAGRDVGASQRTRATASALYRPGGQHLVFLQFAADENGTPTPALGMRWWLTKRASFDLSARRASDGQIVEPRLGLQLGLGR